MVAWRTGSMSQYVIIDLIPRPAAMWLSALPASNRCQHLGGMAVGSDRGPYLLHHALCIGW